MKKTILFLGALLFISTSVFSQKIEITGIYGYMLSGKIKTYYGDFNVYDSPSYGGMFSVRVDQNAFAEFSYTRTDTEFRYRDFWLNDNVNAPISVEYYQLGVVKQVDMDRVRPFGTVSLGMTRMHVKEQVNLEGDYYYVDDAYRFSATVGAGAKVFLTDNIGIRLQARMLLPMEFSGLYLSGGSGGTSGGASFRVPMIQGDFTAGLIIAL